MFTLSFSVSTCSPTIGIDGSKYKAFNCAKNVSHCIPGLWVRDGDEDCADGSDEAGNRSCKGQGGCWSTLNDAPGTQTPNKCSAHFTEKGGIIQSRFYPKNYPDNEDCHYSFLLPPHTTFQLVINSMDIEFSKDDTKYCDPVDRRLTVELFDSSVCLYDYIEFEKGVIVIQGQGGSSKQDLHAGLG